jgi:hypothetical protein
VVAFLAGACNGRPHFNAQRAFDDLETQCEFGPRVPNTEAHDRAGDFIFRSLAATTPLSRRQEFAYFDSASGQNLRLTNFIASYNRDAGRRVMLCAHWDSRPRCEKDPDSTMRDMPVPGANDGASGVAVLLEMGRLFSQSPPPVGVDIVLFDGEDYGINGQSEGWFIGSTYFARNRSGYYPRAAILIDMIGDADLRIHREHISEQYAGDINDFVWGIGLKIAPDVFFDSVRDTVADDHVPLLSAGIKAIDIIDFDYPHWHTRADTPDKCSPRSLEIVGEVLIEAVYGGGLAKF